FAIPLGAGDLRTVQAASAHDLDALGTEAHGVLHRALHGTTEHDALLELLGDRVGDQLGVEFGLAHFLDIHVDRHADNLLEIALERLDVLTLFADDDARAGAVQGDAGVLGGTLNDHTADRSVR